MMDFRKWVRLALAIGAAALGMDALATAQRTFVASYGVDTNPCSILQPCRSFGTAIAQTNPSGEIIVLDSAGYGKVTITASVSIIAPPGVYAGIAVLSGETGVTINAPGANVVLRGLSINGQNGTRGIRLQTAARLHVERCVASNMFVAAIVADVSGGAELTVVDSELTGSGYGLQVSGDGTAYVERTRIEANGNDGVVISSGVVIAFKDVTIANNGGYGLYIVPFTTNAYATLEVSRVFGNGMGGVSVYAGSGAVASLVIADSDIARNGLVGGNRSGVLSVTDLGAGVGTSRVTVTRSRIAYNLNTGIAAVGTGATAYADANVVTENAFYGMNAPGTATIFSRQNSTVHTNGSGQVGGNVVPLVSQ